MGIEMGKVTDTQGYVQNGYDYFFTKRKTGQKEQQTESLMDAISKRKQEIYEKVRRGETETSIPIGAESYTMKQWNKMMRSVDKAIDDMQERIRKDSEKQEEKIKVKKENSITTDMLSELLGIDIRKEKGLSEGEIYYQITGTERYKQDNSQYTVEKGEEGEFLITDKTTGYTYRYDENGCKLQTDRATGRSFLIPCGNSAMGGNIMAVDETLKSMLAQYFGTDKLEEGELTGYTFSRNAATGIEIMIPDGMKGKMAHILFQSKADVEAYHKLADTYKTKYPNLVKSDEMASFYASIEIEGLCHRTSTGILYTNAQGVSYADENDPEKSWALVFDNQSESNYDMIMGMMDEILENGKDIRKCQEWERRLDGQTASYQKVEFDSFAREFVWT
jgi:hypothetical protein